MTRSVSGENSQIMRGTWFVDGTWQPLEEPYATRVETDQMTFFQGHKLPSEKPDSKASVPGRNGSPDVS